MSNSRLVLALVALDVILMITVPVVAERHPGLWWILLALSPATGIAGAVLLWTSRKAANR